MGLPLHGGARHYWAQHYGVEVDEMVDLSTGINPHGWPVPLLPAAAWQRLPEASPSLLKVASDYYGANVLLPVAGSQAAIQLLPQLRTQARVGLFAPAYFEHQQAWERAGHQVVVLERDQVETALMTLDVLVVINPNNPTGALIPPERLRQWHQQLVDRGGWLVVDEAFIDTTPEQSMLAQGAPPTGLIVLRSLGKFFGLAGIRMGFVSASQSLLQRLEQRLGPWSVSHPAQWVAAQALADQAWQQQNRLQLLRESERLGELLQQNGFSSSGSTALFHWVLHDQAESLFSEWARQGVLVRRFSEPASFRVGLPGSEEEWQRLEQLLQSSCG